MAYSQHTSNKTPSGSFAAAFSKAFAATAQMSATEQSKGQTWNGDVNFATMGSDIKSAFLELDQKSVRKVDPSIIAGLLETLISRIDGISDKVKRADAYSILFRYLFHLRKIRGCGKGERDIFYQIFMVMADKFPKTSILLLPLVWQFGYWKDLVNIFIQAQKSKMGPLEEAILDLMYAQTDADLRIVTGGKGLSDINLTSIKLIKSDWEILSTEERIAKVKAFATPITLIGKYLPAEKHGKDKVSNVTSLLVNRFFFEGHKMTEKLTSSDHSTKMKAIKTMSCGMGMYRKVKALLNIALDTPEVKMCDGRWSQLNIEAIASIAMFRYRKALLNEKLKTALSEGDMATGNRHPWNPERVTCREHVQEALKGKALKGAVLGITDLADAIFKCFKQTPGYHHSQGNSRLVVTKWEIDTSRMTVTDRQVICVQWQKALEEVQRIIAEAEAKALEDGVSPDQLQAFKNVLPVIDVSGSMVSAGVMSKAIGLGLLCHELCNHNFVLPFSEEPTPVDLSQCTDIVDKFRLVLCTPWGYSTNADKVNKCVIDICKMASESHFKTTGERLALSTFLPAGVAYFTDGQFDGGYGGGMCPDLTSPTMLTRAQKMVDKVAPGTPLWRAIFWNLNGNAPGFPAQKGAENVQLVSGYSQSLFRQILVGDFEMVVDPVTGVAKPKVDPWVTFLKAVDDPELMPVVEILSSSMEGVLAHFTYTA